MASKAEHIDETAPGADGMMLPVTTSPMEAHIADALPEGPEWQFEPKWDGFRCLAFRHGDEVDLRAKSGKPLGRYFPEMIDALRSIANDDFVLGIKLSRDVGKGARNKGRRNEDRRFGLFSIFPLWDEGPTGPGGQKLRLAAAATIKKAEMRRPSLRQSRDVVNKPV